MARKKLYLTLDTETATLPFIKEWELTAKQKQNIAIAKPLVYDIGWTVTDRMGNIVLKRNYLIQETFFVPNVFNTAYYKDKRPIYMQLLADGAIEVATWEQAIERLQLDLDDCDIATAYNACFDYKKAIPFTERYIKALYSNHYNEWEERQRKSCRDIANGINDSENPDYLEPFFELRGVRYPIVDLWGLACERLINIDKYRNYCLDNGLLSASALYFKTSAETSFQYLMNKHDFIEDHTALSDAEIEAQILTKALKKGKVEPQLGAFPFRELGTTYDYACRHPKYAEVVYEKMNVYYSSNCTTNSGYWTRVENMIAGLEYMLSK